MALPREAAPAGPGALHPPRDAAIPHGWQPVPARPDRRPRPQPRDLSRSGGVSRRHANREDTIVTITAAVAAAMSNRRPRGHSKPGAAHSSAATAVQAEPRGARRRPAWPPWRGAPRTRLARRRAGGAGPRARRPAVWRGWPARGSVWALCRLARVALRQAGITTDLRRRTSRSIPARPTWAPDGFNPQHL